MNVGILALQGNFALHQQRLVELGAKAILLRHAAQLAAVDALVIPGGESTTLLRLLDQSFRDALCEAAKEDIPILATCAGLIILAKEVSNPAQDSLGVLDISVKRNTYGRQVDSFIDPSLRWTDTGKTVINSLPSSFQNSSLEGVFIRAPGITRVGPEVEVLVRHQNEPVLIRQNNILGATFHPELSQNAATVHRLLINTLVEA